MPASKRHAPPPADQPLVSIVHHSGRGHTAEMARADASISDLARGFHMTLTGMKKHVGILESAGLVSTEKLGRLRTRRLGARRLEEEAAWIERHRRLWEARFDGLDRVVEDPQRGRKATRRQAAFKSDSRRQA